MLQVDKKLVRFELELLRFVRDQMMRRDSWLRVRNRLKIIEKSSEEAKERVKQKITATNAKFSNLDRIRDLRTVADRSFYLMRNATIQRALLYFQVAQLNLSIILSIEPALSNIPLLSRL